jgi:hypothetical protein
MDYGVLLRNLGSPTAENRGAPGSKSSSGW